jgi:hypothetical protein
MYIYTIWLTGLKLNQLHYLYAVVKLKQTQTLNINSHYCKLNFGNGISSASDVMFLHSLVHFLELHSGIWSTIGVMVIYHELAGRASYETQLHYVKLRLVLRQKNGFILQTSLIKFQW